MASPVVLPPEKRGCHHDQPSSMTTAELFKPEGSWGVLNRSRGATPSPVHSHSNPPLNSTSLLPRKILSSDSPSLSISEYHHLPFPLNRRKKSSCIGMQARSIKPLHGMGHQGHHGRSYTAGTKLLQESEDHQTST